MMPSRWKTQTALWLVHISDEGIPIELRDPDILSTASVRLIDGFSPNGFETLLCVWVRENVRSRISLQAKLSVTEPKNSTRENAR